MSTVHVVITYDDVPGRERYLPDDQPQPTGAES